MVKRDALLQELRDQYENNLQIIYKDSYENLIDDEQTSNLINVNRTIFLSTESIVNALSILHATDPEFESEIISPEHP